MGARPLARRVAWPLPPPGSAQYAHLIAESLRRSFIDRNSKLGDPAFVKVPMDELTSKKYATSLAKQIDRTAASKTPALRKSRVSSSIVLCTRALTTETPTPCKPPET